jgi:hypothetical protein
MNTPHGASERSGTRARARLTGVGHSNALCSPQRAAQEKPFVIRVGFPHPMLPEIKCDLPPGGNPRDGSFEAHCQNEAQSFAASVHESPQPYIHNHA